MNGAMLIWVENAADMLAGFVLGFGPFIGFSEDTEGRWLGWISRELC